MTIRKPILTGVALAAAVALAGCSSANSRSSETAAGTPGAKGTVSSSPAISGTQLTGTQLTAALLTSNEMPVGGFFAASGPNTDSGGSLTTATAKFNPSVMSCTDLQNDLGEAGFGETAMSTSALLSERKETVSQTVYQFANASAATTFYTAAKANWASCRSFTIGGQGSDGEQTSTVTTAKAGVGQQDFATTETGTVNGTPSVIVTTMALDGPDVLMVGAAKLGTATAPTDVDTGSLMAKLIVKVAAAG